METYTPQEAARKNRAPGSHVEPMTAFAEYADGTRYEFDAADGPEALRWMNRETRAGAVKVGYRPV